MQKVNILYIGDNESHFKKIKHNVETFDSVEVYDILWINRYSEAINALLKKNVAIAIIDETLEAQSSYEFFREAINSKCTPSLILLYKDSEDKNIDKILDFPIADKLKIEELSERALTRCISYTLRNQRELNSLKQNELKFRTLFERSQEPMFIVRDGLISDVNKSMQELMGAGSSSLIRHEFKKLFANQLQYFNYINQLEKLGNITEMELTLLTPTDDRILCDISSFTQISQHGDTQHYFCHIKNSRSTDLSETEVCGYESEMLSMAEEIRNAAIEFRNNPRRHRLLDIIRSHCEKIIEISASMIIILWL